MRKLTTEEFITKAKAVHGDIYSYSNTKYERSYKKLKITCSMHGEFEQTPDVHLMGGGCRKCKFEAASKRQTKDTDYFIEKAITTHGDKYDYRSSVYLNNRTKVKIICKIHGEFYQTPDNHVSGTGCPSCKNEESSLNQSLNTEEFIERARSVHGNLYQYDKAIYKNSYTRLIIKCKEHGEFAQKPKHHLSGSGCPSCAGFGFNRTTTGFVYFLSGEMGIKVGITNNTSRRIKQLKSRTPFEFNLIAKVKTTGAEAMRKEKYYHDKYESAGLTGFDGATEWLRYSPELMNEIMNENPSV